MALIGWTNAVDSAAVTLAASSAAVGYAPDMLRIPLGAASVAWQTASGVTTATLTLTATSALTWRAVCLARTNLTPSATMRVQAGAYDSGTISAGVGVGIGQALHVLPSPVTASAMTITIADPTNPDGVLNVPLLFAGPCQQTALSPGSQPNLEVGRDDSRTRGGIVIPQPLWRARSWSLRLGAIREADLTWLEEMQAAAAAATNILVIPREGHPRASAEAVFGLLSPGPLAFVGSTGAWRTWTATITERL